MVNLFPYQLDAVDRMHNGCILHGGVGSGKSRTSLAYYVKDCGGWLHASTMTNPHSLYIITTARKRDTLEWEEELTAFGLSDVTIDSWNNIKKYRNVRKSFFIFDEQRAVGRGVWAKAFIEIAKNNHWVLLSATPGDTWLDYVPVFIANGFYKNPTEFSREHVVYSRFSKYPKVDRYVGVHKLQQERDQVLVDMEYTAANERKYTRIVCEYDKIKYRDANRTRWNIYKDEPMMNASDLCYTLRRICNSDPDRIRALTSIAMDHKKLIVFYNFDYELDILKSWADDCGLTYAEYNGHEHQPIPETTSWAYFVQYTAGAEGWNCTSTDTIVFYSQNYSYKIMEQASGRIDRLNTPYKRLNYFCLLSSSPIDLAIKNALNNKRNFNESAFSNIKT